MGFPVMPGSYAFPANFALQCLQTHIPDATLFAVNLRQNGHLCLPLWIFSITRTRLRSINPYLAPHLPVLPTFLVLTMVLNLKFAFISFIREEPELQNIWIQHRHLGAPVGNVSL